MGKTISALGKFYKLKAAYESEPGVGLHSESKQADHLLK